MAKMAFSAAFSAGCDCKLLNPLTDISGIRVLSRLGRPTRSSRAPHRHDSDARAVTRALCRGGRNHVGPANVLSCASRLQDPSPRHARRNRADFRLKKIPERSMGFRSGTGTADNPPHFGWKRCRPTSQLWPSSQFAVLQFDFLWYNVRRRR